MFSDTQFRVLVQVAFAAFPLKRQIPETSPCNGTTAFVVLWYRPFSWRSVLELHYCTIFIFLTFRLVMSKQRFLKIVCFHFPTNVPQKNRIYSFLKQNSFSNPKRSLSDLHFFGLYSNVLLLLKKSWNTSKIFGFVP